MHKRKELRIFFSSDSAQQRCSLCVFSEACEGGRCLPVCSRTRLLFSTSSLSLNSIFREGKISWAGRTGSLGGSAGGLETMTPAF